MGSLGCTTRSWMDQEGPETVYKDKEEPTLAMYAATMARLTVSAIAHPKGL